MGKKLDPTSASIRAKLREAVEASGMTQQEIGDAMGYEADSARKAVSRLLNPNVDYDPRLSTLLAFAKAIKRPLNKSFVDQSVRILGKSRLDHDRGIMCLRLLLEGNSIRSTSRLTGVCKDAIIALVVEIGERCKQFLREAVRRVPVDDVECDEIWAFIGMKERTRKKHGKGEEFGDCYTFTAIERTTKLLLAWHCGKRDNDNTFEFVVRLSAATEGRFQVTTDGFQPYRPAIPRVLGDRVDFAALIKSYGPSQEQHRYSPPVVTSCESVAQWGSPDDARICTSYVERNNLSMRMGIRRFTRLTNAHSKKWVNHEAAVALWFAYYNFCRVHMTLKTTPAVAAELTDHVWSVKELLTHVAKNS